MQIFLVVLVTGMIHSNLDLFSLHDDVHLWDALHCSHLVNPFNSGEEKLRPWFTLDTTIEPEGSNLSIRECSLLSLAWALCKDSQIVIMDEATARYSFLFASRLAFFGELNWMSLIHVPSMDLETDSKIQEAVLVEFSSRTILCIAHHLRTIIHYDKILILAQGQAIVSDIYASAMYYDWLWDLQEFNTPLNLFDCKDGVFWTLCCQSHIGWKEIEVGIESLESWNHPMCIVSRILGFHLCHMQHNQTEAKVVSPDRHHAGCDIYF
jgi:ATP-binding cassette, subfamily C (CFTR/MRP), member 1